MLLSSFVLCLLIFVTRAEAAPADTVEISGGDFHNLGAIHLQKKTGNHRIGIHEGMNEEKDSVVKIDGGYFHDINSVKEKRDTDESTRCEGYRGRVRKLCRLYYAALEDTEDSFDNTEGPSRVLAGGNYKGLGKGEGSLSDITGAKDHVITSGDFHDFGDISG